MGAAKVLYEQISGLSLPFPFPQLPPSYHRPTTVDSVSWKTSEHQIWPFSHKARGKTLNMSGQSLRQIGQIEMFHKYLENTNLCLVSNKYVKLSSLEVFFLSLSANVKMTELLFNQF